MRIVGADKTIGGTAGPFNYSVRFKTKTQNNNAGNGLEKDALIFYHEGWSGLNVASFPNSTLGIGVEDPGVWSSSANNLVVKDASGNGGITIVNGTSDIGSIFFADGTSTNSRGRIRYQHSDDSLILATAETTALTISSSQNATFAGTVSDSKGDLRAIVRSVKSSAYTLVASDAGKCIYINTGGVTINANVFGTDGHAVTIVNDSGSDQTITQGSGLSLYNTADATTGNRTRAGRGMATVWFASGTSAYISGAGLS